MNWFRGKSFNFPILKQHRDRAEAALHAKELQDAAAELQTNSNALRDDLQGLFDEFQENEKSLELMRAGLVEIARLMDSGRINEARVLINLYTAGLSK